MEEEVSSSRQVEFLRVDQQQAVDSNSSNLVR
jgi:hypothetical protein